MVVYCYCGLMCSVTTVSPARTAEPIEMPFRVSTWVCPRNHVLLLDDGPDRKEHFPGKKPPHFSTRQRAAFLVKQHLVSLAADTKIKSLPPAMQLCQNSF